MKDIQPFDPLPADMEEDFEIITDSELKELLPWNLMTN